MNSFAISPETHIFLWSDTMNNMHLFFAVLLKINEQINWVEGWFRGGGDSRSWKRLEGSGSFYSYSVLITPVPFVVRSPMRWCRVGIKCCPGQGDSWVFPVPAVHLLVQRLCSSAGGFKVNRSGGLLCSFGLVVHLVGAGVLPDWGITLQLRWQTNNYYWAFQIG